MLSKKKYRYLLMVILVLGICVGELYEYIKLGTVYTSVPLKPVGLPVITSFRYILMRNTLAYILLMASFILGKPFVFFFFFFFANGMNIGRFLHYLTLKQTIFLFLPHGIFEYYAYCILAITIIYTLNDLQKLRSYFILKNMAIGYIILCCGSLVESTITPALGRMLC